MRYLRGRHRNQGGREFLEEILFKKIIYSSFRKFEIVLFRFCFLGFLLFCFVFFSFHLNSLKTRRGDFLGKHCVLSAACQGQGRLWTNLQSPLEETPIMRNGGIWFIRNIFSECANKASSTSSPLLSLPLCTPELFQHQPQPCSYCFAADPTDTAVAADLLRAQDRALSFQILSFHPFIPTAQRKWKNESQLLSALV